MKNLFTAIGGVIGLAVSLLSYGADRLAAGSADGAGVVQAAEVRWEPIPGDPVWQAILEDGKQIGAYRPDTGEYASLDAATGQWRRSRDKAFCREDARAAILLARRPGLDWAMVQKEPPGYRINGRMVTEADALTALKPSPKLPDDTSLPSLTVIGTEGECAAVERDVERHPVLSKMRDRFLFQAYRPNDLMVSRYGFVTGGRPTIYMTEPSGKVLFRSDEYPGVDILADAVRVAADDCCPPRKPRPDYEPARDPEPLRVIRHGKSLADYLLWVAGFLVALVVEVALIVIVVAATMFAVRRLSGKPPAPPSPPAAA